MIKQSALPIDACCNWQISPNQNIKPAKIAKGALLALI
jgi:hypothetical protein